MADDRVRIEELYRSHGPMVLRRAQQILGTEDEAREVLQEIFLGLLKEPAQWSGASSALTWLYSATTHRCLNRIRDARTRRHLLDERAKAEPGSSPPAAEAHVAVRDFLGALKGDLALAAIYFYLDEMTYDEIAKVMGCSRRHVGHLLEDVRARAEEKQKREGT